MITLKKCACYFMASAFVFSCLNTQAVSAKTFSDVEGGRWSHEAVNKLSDDGVINGYEDGTFKPTGLVTYAELITMIVMSQGIDTSGKTPYFNHWAGKSAAAYLETASCREDRYPLTIMNEKVSRAEMAEMIGYVIKDGGVSENKFDDIAALTPSQISGIDKLYSKGIVSGMSETKFDPDTLVTREQAAMAIFKLKYDAAVSAPISSDTAPLQPTGPVIYNPVNTTGLELADIAKDTPHAAEIITLAKLDIMPGYDDGNWFPKNELTRGEFFYAVQRIAVSVDARELLETYTPKFSHFAASEYSFLQSVDIVNRSYDNIAAEIDEPITKEEIAIYLCNLYMYNDVSPEYKGYEKVDNYSDIRGLSEDDNIKIRRAVDLGMVSPKSDKEFGVDNGVTREQFAVWAYGYIPDEKKNKTENTEQTEETKELEQAEETEGE